MKQVLATVILLAGVSALVLTGQGNAALAGSWTLADGGGGGRRGGGIPGVPLATEVVITVSPTTVTVDTNTGSAQTKQTAVYRLDGSETTVPGPLGWTVTAKAAWKDSTLVVNTLRSLEGPNGPIGAEVIDVYRVEGDVLTVERSQGRARQQLVYNRKR